MRNDGWSVALDLLLRRKSDAKGSSGIRGRGRYHGVRVMKIDVIDVFVRDLAPAMRSKKGVRNTRLTFEGLTVPEEQEASAPQLDFPIRARIQGKGRQLKRSRINLVVFGIYQMYSDSTITHG